MTIRVLIVDDHPIVVDGLVAGLRSHGIDVRGSASSIRAAREFMAQDDLDVVLVDLRLPDGSGTALMRGIADPGGPAFIVLSSFSSPEYLEVAMRLGARGYLLKTAKTTEIVSAIRRVVAGRPAFTPAQLLEGHAARWEPLTEREAAIVRRVVDGRSNDEIGTDLGISTKRVEAHLTRLFERYRVASRTELAVRAERDGWLDLPRRDMAPHTD
jgi:DNA-binding NarL/FixJ family response regulator